MDDSIFLVILGAFMSFAVTQVISDMNKEKKNIADSTINALSVIFTGKKRKKRGGETLEINMFIYVFFSLIFWSLLITGVSMHFFEISLLASPTAKVSTIAMYDLDGVLVGKPLVEYYIHAFKYGRLFEEQALIVNFLTLAPAFLIGKYTGTRIKDKFIAVKVLSLAFLLVFTINYLWCHQGVFDQYFTYEHGMTMYVATLIAGYIGIIFGTNNQEQYLLCQIYESCDQKTKTEISNKIKEIAGNKQSS